MTWSCIFGTAQTRSSCYPFLCCCVNLFFSSLQISAFPLSSPTSVVNDNIGGGQGEIPTTPIQEKDENNRRTFLHNTFGSVITTAALVRPPDAVAAISTKKAAPLFDPSALVQVGLETEQLLLKLLPVKNRVFRGLEKDLWGVSVLRSLEAEVKTNESAWIALISRMQTSINYIDSQRGRLEPVFNQDDSTAVEIAKAERGERLVEELREEINVILIQSMDRDADKVLLAQGRALRLLSELGELLVNAFPYNIPTEGKFSYLPRLLGRAKVTFTMKRTSGKLLGNVTILADGFAAPITAGNFVDLSARDFYTGLPVKLMSKRLGVKPLTFADETSDTVAYDIVETIDKLKDEFDLVFSSSEPGTITTNLPILGSFNEGFYDPLTAKPRRIPLEVLSKDPLEDDFKLSYEEGFSGFAPSEPNLSQNSTILNFDTPGLVASNHPDKNFNGGSSEFFCLQEDDRKPDEVKLLNENYAPFGYVIGGLDIMERLEPGDMITSTFVNEWGQLNLKRIRGSRFADAMNKDDDN